jgi:hypothetical protein
MTSCQSNSVWDEDHDDTSTVSHSSDDTTFSRPPSGIASHPPLSYQQLGMAFQILDRDGDGLITRTDAHKLVAYYLVGSCNVISSAI